MVTAEVVLTDQGKERYRVESGISGRSMRLKGTEGSNGDF